MDRQVLKQLLEQLELVVDGVVKATPGIWDNIVWAGVKKTVFSDVVIDRVLDQLGIKGIVVSQVAPPQ